MTDSLFGFVVTECKVWDPETCRFTDVPTGSWDVHLPHMCGEWAITDEYLGAGHAQAVASLEAFIAEAQEALAALKRREQFGDQNA